MTLSGKIYLLRTRRELSQEDLAAALGVSRQSVSKWETGQSVPDLDKIIRMADLFGVSVDELVREGDPPAPPQAEPRVVYLMQEKKGFTGTQKAGVCAEILGVVLFLLGVMGLGAIAAVVGAALLLLGLPLLLAKKHPWLILGWLAVGLSLMVPLYLREPLGPDGRAAISVLLPDYAGTPLLHHIAGGRDRHWPGSAGPGPASEHAAGRSAPPAGRRAGGGREIPGLKGPFW